MFYRSKDFSGCIFPLIVMVLSAVGLEIVKGYVPQGIIRVVFTVFQVIFLILAILFIVSLINNKKGLKFTEKIEREKTEEIESAGREIFFTFISPLYVFYVTSLGVECYYREKFPKEKTALEFRDFYVEAGEIKKVEIVGAFAMLHLNDGTKLPLLFNANKTAVYQFKKAINDSKKTKQTTTI